MTNPATAIAGGIRIPLLVQPRASRARFGPLHGDRIKIAITSAPLDGAANKAVIELIAKTFGVARGHVSITAGQTSRRKTVQVLGVTLAEIEPCIE